MTWTAEGQLDPIKIELDPDGNGAAPYVEITNAANRPTAASGSWSVSGWYDNAGAGTLLGTIQDFKTD